MGRDPKAEIEITAHSKSLGAKLREARSKFGAFGAELKKNVFGKDMVEKGFWGKAGASMIGNLGARAASSVLSFGIEEAKGIWNYNDALTRLQITSNKTPEYMQALSKSLITASNATGLGAPKILEAAANYVALTGDMNGASAAAAQWANIAQATNSAVGDIAGTAAALKTNMKIGPEDTTAAFAALAIQGKAGAIELKDLSAQLSSIAPQWAEFGGGDKLQGLKEMGAALQAVKRGFGGDAGETVTGLQSMLNALIKNAARFKGAGIKIFDKDPTTGAKKMRNVLDIVRSIGDSKLVNDPTKLEKAFGRVEAYRAFLQMRDGLAAKPGEKSFIEDLVEKSGDVKVIERDLKTYVESPAGRVARAWEGLKNRMTEALTPERLEMFATGIEHILAGVEGVGNALGKVGDALGFFSSVGKSIRGAFSGDGDPYADQIAPDRMRERLETIGGEQDPNRKNALARKLQLDMQNSAGYKSTIADILSAETNEKSSPESLKRAIAARYSPNNGASEAGKFYMTSAGYKDPMIEARRIVDEYNKEHRPELEQRVTQELLRDIRNGISDFVTGNKTIAVDGKALVEVGQNSRVHRGRPKT